MEEREVEDADTWFDSRSKECNNGKDAIEVDRRLKPLSLK